MPKKSATLKQIVEMLDNAGWEEGFPKLLELHKTQERIHASLAAGGYEEQRMAAKMMPGIAKQDETLVRLTQIAKERGIMLDARH